MITPIPVIINNTHEPDKCPNCGHDEEIIEVCKHCKYEYPEEEGSGWVTFFIIVAIIVSLFMIFSFVAWAMKRSLEYDPYTSTYVQFIKEIFVAFWNLLKHIV